MNLCVLGALGVMCVGGVARTQPGDTTPPVIPRAQGTGQSQEGRVSGSVGELFKRIDEVEVIRRAGLKASLLRQAQQVLPFVIVVDDAPSYLYAISQWEALVRFPVLWDDGSIESREHIARFVRSFQPEKVLRLEDDGDWSFSGGREERVKSIERSLAKALSEQSNDWRVTIKSINDQGIVSPGVVLTDPLDDAWAAALALAAGRMQPIGFMTKPANIWKPLEPEAADLIEREAERLAASTGRSWDTQGDEIDTITLAMNTGTQIKTGGNVRARLATSDRIGRREHNGAGARWAWCGQIVGNESRVVYQAMCSLFLEIDQAFIWDGYGSRPPWNQYDGSEAAMNLKDAGLRVELNDQPKHNIDYWYQRMVNPIGDRDGGAASSLMFLMNSKGSPTRFDLPGSIAEEGRPGDMPVLQLPAAMHIVHSFSLQQPPNRKTVGGRLLERGIYAYAGSVDEPYLGGFVPTPLIARRLAAGIAFGAAIRFEEGQVKSAEGFDPGRVWKIAVLGDPLTTFGSAGHRIDAELLIDSLIDLDNRVKQLLKDTDYGGALDDLVMLGRDDDAARLSKALLNDKPELFTPQMALVALPALHRSGEFVTMVDCYERLDVAGRKDGLMQDLLWLASPYLLARGQLNYSFLARVEALLRVNLREGQQIRDAERLAMHLRSRSLGSALSVLESLREGLNESQATMLDKAIARVKK